MPRYDIICQSGHAAEVTRSVSQRRDPCPTCGAPVELVWTAHRRMIITDDIPGGQWFENGFDRPRKFYAHSEHRRALAELGREIAAKHAGPLDKICQRWDAVDAQTLENARVLVSRGRMKGAEDPGGEFPPAVPDQPITGRRWPAEE